MWDFAYRPSICISCARWICSDDSLEWNWNQISVIWYCLPAMTLLAKVPQHYDLTKHLNRVLFHKMKRRKLWRREDGSDRKLVRESRKEKSDRSHSEVPSRRRSPLQWSSLEWLILILFSLLSFNSRHWENVWRNRFISSKVFLFDRPANGWSTSLYSREDLLSK